MSGLEGTRSLGNDILVVEDSPTQAQLLQLTLEEYGYQVRLAQNGEVGLDLLRQERPLLVISDVVMPGIDGFELCRQIKSQGDTKSIPVILLTSLSDPTDIIKGLECGADNFIVKPYSEEFLIFLVQHIAVNQQLRRDSMSEMGLEVFFAGRKHFITSDRMQIIDLLLSTYHNIMEKNKELKRLNQELQQTNLELRQALETIKTLHGLLPICANCKKIRDDEGYWRQIEEYLQQHADVEFSHGLCPECIRKLYPDFTES
jgi:two-component system cell cycle response regulator